MHSIQDNLFNVCLDDIRIYQHTMQVRWNQVEILTKVRCKFCRVLARMCVTSEWLWRTETEPVVSRTEHRFTYAYGTDACSLSSMADGPVQ